MNTQGLPLLTHPDLWMKLEEDHLLVLDRRKLPGRVEFVRCATGEEVARAIEDMVVQGAGDLGLVAGYGLVLEARQNVAEAPGVQAERLRRAAARLQGTRPTGNYLARVLDGLLAVATGALGEGRLPVEPMLESLRGMIEARDGAVRRTARFAESILADGDAVLTHCFAGATLIYALKFARENGKEVRVLSTETRPYLQGQRLTSFSLQQLGVPVVQICDNMPAYCMSRGLVSKVFTGADRVALDGSVANKVGTFQYAIAAHYHGIPFYVLSYRGPDPGTPDAGSIPVEERDPEEVLNFAGVRLAAPGVRGYYPAFDITPPDLITAIITDRGVFPAHLIRRYLAGESGQDSAS